MSETRADSVSLNIDNMLMNSSFPPSKPSMFRVDDHLRSVNPEAYEPVIIAIGPFHRGNSRLKEMEEHKKWYLNLLLERREEPSVESYVTTIRSLEAEARKCYAEDIQLGEDDFVQMLILDGCFIIEFLHRFLQKVHRHEDDTIFKREDTQTQLLHDLMLFENQIPFFIIESLFEMIKMEDVDINSLIKPLLANGIFPVDQQNLPLLDPSNAHHLLGIVHDIQCSSFAVHEENLSHMDSENSGTMLNNISSAVELEEAGISFKRSKGNNFFHIEFKNKALIIPEWEVNDSTDLLIRNLTAYEHYLPGRPKKYVTDYVFFMLCLVHSSEDAKLLRRSGIIINNLAGSDEMVYQVINQLGKIVITSNDFCYSNIFNNVNLHCSHRWNIWMAKLRREYFNSPWALISFFAAITALVLTIAQTTLAILSYRNDLKNG